MSDIEFGTTIHISKGVELDTETFEDGEPFVVLEDVEAFVVGMNNHALRVRLLDVPFDLYFHQKE